MTDKEIITDGVDVSRCEYACNTAFGKNGCKHPMMKNIYCSKNPNCYFKQLTLKTQECEELNNEIIDMNSIIEDAAINLGNKDFTLYDLPFEIKKLSQECENLKAEEKYLKQCCQKAGEELAKHSFEYDGKEKNLVVQAIELNEKYEELKEDRYNLNMEMYMLDRYRKALEEIEEHYEKVVKNLTTYDDSYDANISIEALHNISDIINKVKGETNA